MFYMNINGEIKRPQHYQKVLVALIATAMVVVAALIITALTPPTTTTEATEPATETTTETATEEFSPFFEVPASIFEEHIGGEFIEARRINNGDDFFVVIEKYDGEFEEELPEGERFSHIIYFYDPEGNLLDYRTF